MFYYFLYHNFISLFPYSRLGLDSFVFNSIILRNATLHAAIPGLGIIPDKEIYNFNFEPQGEITAPSCGELTKAR